MPPRSLLTLLALTLPALLCRAALTPDQSRSEARLCRDRSSEAIQLYENLEARLAHHAAFMRPDLLQARKAYESAAEAWRVAADAYDELDPAAATVRAAADDAARACNLWRDRLETREKQALAAPSEGTYAQLRFNTGPLGKEALGLLIEARKDASEAWGNLADAMQPAAERDHLASLLEQAQQKAAEVELASANYTTIDRRERLSREGNLTSPRVAEALTALKKLDDERQALQREEMVRAARLRDLDRRRLALEDQLRQASEEAKKTGAK